VLQINIPAQLQLDYNKAVNRANKTQRERERKNKTKQPNHLPSHVGYFESHSTVIIAMVGVAIIRLISVEMLVISSHEVGCGRHQREYKKIQRK
jgi:hypothetical protein